MIKFEEHDGKLFRILDEPVPLTPDAEMPCLIREILIIDEGSPMGRAIKLLNRTARFLLDMPYTAISGYDSVKSNARELPMGCHAMYEIVGTHVKDGSKDWALYQMMQGEKVFRVEWECDMYCQYTNNEIITFRYGISSTINPVEEWIANAKRADFGWQIYHEPKPEPIFTTGDKVTDGVIEGTIIHIEDAIADVCPSTDEYKIALSNLNHIPESPKQDDVEKPLRSMIAEAKAIGKNIRIYYQDIVFTPQALEACLNQGKFRWWNICNWELTTREQNYFPSISTSSDRQNPTYKVGDWVEWCGDQYMVESAPPQSGGRYNIRSPYDELGCSVCPKNITRKLSPYEVVIHIGCMSGTVKDLSYVEDGRFWFIGKKTERCPGGMHAILYDEMLDAPTRDLVESLLEAQKRGDIK